MNLGTAEFHNTQKVDMKGNGGDIKTVTKTGDKKEIGGISGAGTTVLFNFGTWM